MPSSCPAEVHAALPGQGSPRDAATEGQGLPPGREGARRRGDRSVPRAEASSVGSSAEGEPGGSIPARGRAEMLRQAGVVRDGLRCPPRDVCRSETPAAPRCLLKSTLLVSRCSGGPGGVATCGDGATAPHPTGQGPAGAAGVGPAAELGHRVRGHVLRPAVSEAGSTWRSMREDVDFSTAMEPMPSTVRAARIQREREIAPGGAPAPRPSAGPPARIRADDVRPPPPAHPAMRRHRSRRRIRPPRSSTTSGCPGLLYRWMRGRPAAPVRGPDSPSSAHDAVPGGGCPDLWDGRPPGQWTPVRRAGRVEGGRP